MHKLNLYIKQKKFNKKNVMEENVIAMMMIIITQVDTIGQYTMIMMNIKCEMNMKCMIMIDYMEHMKIIEM